MTNFLAKSMAFFTLHFHQIFEEKNWKKGGCMQHICFDAAGYN
jgi:hypothetical protein